MGFILKPTAANRGRGIALAEGPEAAAAWLSRQAAGSSWVVQRYVPDPLLLPVRGGTRGVWSVARAGLRQPVFTATQQQPFALRCGQHTSRMPKCLISCSLALLLQYWQTHHIIDGK